MQLASDGNLEDSNKYIQLIMDSLAADESDSAMELKAKTIAALSTWQRTCCQRWGTVTVEPVRRGSL